LPTCDDSLISENLISYLTTHLWMIDQQDKTRNLMNLKIEFEDVTPEIEEELKKWFNGMIVNSPGRWLRASKFKATIGRRQGMFPVAMDHKGICFICDAISGSI